MEGEEAVFEVAVPFPERETRQGAQAGETPPQAEPRPQEDSQAPA